MIELSETTCTQERPWCPDFAAKLVASRIHMMSLHIDADDAASRCLTFNIPRRALQLS